MPASPSTGGVRTVRCILMKILWYVSSHGWGHGARQRELIRVYRRKNPHTHITVASDIPEWLWKNSDIDSFISGSPSPVAIETEGDIDLRATRVHFLNFVRNSSSFLQAEVQRQSIEKPDLIITDIDPLPVKAAEINNIPALGIGNFTWDWIMLEMFPDLSDEAVQIAEMYSHGTYLKLPMGPDHSPFHSTIDVPLLRGGAPGNCNLVKDLLPGGKVYLVALRETLPGISLSFPEGITAVSCLPEPVHAPCFNITPEELSGPGASFADLVAACDVLVTKPGYGIVSQILSMGKRAVLLTGRKFPEEKCLIDALWNRSGISFVEVPRLSPSSIDIPAVAELKDTSPVISNGADIIAQIIAQSPGFPACSSFPYNSFDIS